MCKSKLLNSVLLSLFFISISYSQAYYPKLNNLFLEEENESVFNNETAFFRLGLRKNFNKLFYGDLQTSSNGSNSNYTAFYGLKIVPRFIMITDFFDTNVKLKFNVVDPDSKYPSFPITYTEHLMSEDDKKTGKGDFSLSKGSLSLQFGKSIIDSKNENQIEFLIASMHYEFANDKFSIDLKGEFSDNVKIKKTTINSNSDSSIKIIVEKNNFQILVCNMNKEYKIIDKLFVKEDFQK